MRTPNDTAPFVCITNIYTMDWKVISPTKDPKIHILCFVIWSGVCVFNFFFLYVCEEYSINIFVDITLSLKAWNWQTTFNVEFYVCTVSFCHIYLPTWVDMCVLLKSSYLFLLVGYTRSIPSIHNPKYWLSFNRFILIWLKMSTTWAG